MKKEIYNKHRQNPNLNPIDAYFQGITHGVSQEALHTLEKEQAIIKSDIANIKDNMVTKAEFSEFKAEVKTDIKELKEDIAKLGGCIAIVRAESKEDNNNLRIELKQDIHNLQSNMQGWMITILVAIIGGIIALLYKS